MDGLAMTNGMLGKQCLIVVSKLLDVPVKESDIFDTGGVKSYVLRLLDYKRRELDRSDPIEGLDLANLAPDQKQQSFGVPQDLGTLQAKTNFKTVYVQVEYSGGLLGGQIIGECKINRSDSRSSQPWPYEVAKDDGEVVGGIELCVVEGGGMAADGSINAPPMASIGLPPTAQSQGMLGSGRMGTMGAGMASLGSAPTGPLGSMPPSAMAGPVRNPSLGTMPPMTDGEMEDVHHGVSAMVELEGVKDLPAPRSTAMRDVMITIMTDSGKELRKIGLFPTQEQASRNLVSVNCKQTRAFVQAPLHFGGDAQEGAQYIKLSVSYGKKAGRVIDSELVGLTDAIKVTWKPTIKQYFELRSPEQKVLGGIYLSCRLVTEAEAVGQRNPEDQQLKIANRQPVIGPPVEPEHRVSGRTGHFPPGSQEEAFEQAVINAEAQNRALLQRCKKEDKTSHVEPHVRVVNGWREWNSLDSLFESMGPNPLTLSDELGPQVARGYQHNTNMAKEIGKHLPPANTPADQLLDLEMLRMYYKEDPSEIEAHVRPVICKDPNEIAAPRDMQWCPDPPIYTPLRDMTEEDKETLRLACYKPEQNAALMFNDANPNYNMRDDIWGALSGNHKPGVTYLSDMPMHHTRVKDDCLMA